MSWRDKVKKAIANENVVAVLMTPDEYKQCQLDLYGEIFEEVERSLFVALRSVDLSDGHSS